MFNARMVNVRTSCVLCAQIGDSFLVFARIPRIKNPVKYVGTFDINQYFGQTSKAATTASGNYPFHLSNIGT
jgi:hypothetical protein